MATELIVPKSNKPAKHDITKKDFMKAALTLVAIPLPAYAEATRLKGVEEGSIKYAGRNSSSLEFRTALYAAGTITGFLYGTDASLGAFFSGAGLATSSALFVGIPWGIVNAIGFTYKNYYDLRRIMHKAGKALTTASVKVKRSAPCGKLTNARSKIKDSEVYRKTRNAIAPKIKKLSDLCDLGL